MPEIQLADGLSRGAAVDLLALPDESLLDAVVDDAGLELEGGQIRRRRARDDLGRAEAAVAELESRLSAEPFRAPEADELSALHLGVRELAAAERAGRLLRLRDGVVLLPTAPALAMRELVRLEQPFTTSQARQALVDHAPCGHPAARTPRRARLDPSIGRRPPRDRAFR